MVVVAHGGDRAKFVQFCAGNAVPDEAFWWQS